MSQPAATFAPCPHCGGTNAKTVGFTWWGGLIGPKILNHVQCLDCRKAYNGKTGKDNTNGIVIYTVVCLAIAAVIVGIFIVGAVIAALS